MARSESGTRCGLLPFMRWAGMDQTLAFRSISSHVAFRTSDVRAAVRAVNSSALAEMVLTLRSSRMNAGSSANGMASW